MMKRMRGGVGTIDPDSDMEPDIDVSATADTSTDRIKLDHRQFESKRQKSTHLQSAPEPPALPVDNTQEKIDGPVEEVKKKQVNNHSEICMCKVINFKLCRAHRS
jgi:hypothetical protein